MVEHIRDTAIKLTDYDVRVESIFDLRYLAQKLDDRIDQSVRLKDLSKNFLDIKLFEFDRLANSHWKKKTINLDTRNVNYAAKTVRVAIELFKHFEEKLVLENSSNEGVQTFINEHCKPHLNHIYRNRTKEAGQNQSTETVDKQTVQENELLSNPEIHVICNVEDCETMAEQLRKHCNEYNVLGFGCRYSANRQTVSLLQLASHRGLCALVQLRKLKTIPTKLQDILEDEHILKIGDDVSFNVNRLERDYG
ncbi:uncharacterized protein LOC129578178 [Sitodiplosis mosellana]|uniref:uncharacterized protein LOC129578178 n=1 Tax=Sitodiplosis mosellana TaxID=263140 RepID=UPI0024443480|nr:uncharacterized protein LOC129578178 [Sitodiplosis mosellana]